MMMVAGAYPSAFRIQQGCVMVSLSLSRLTTASFVNLVCDMEEAAFRYAEGRARLCAYKRVV